MKRTILLLLATLLLIGILSACSEEPVATEAPNKKVGICLPADTDVDYTYFAEQLKVAGYDVTTHIQNSDQATQITMVKELSARGYDLLIIEPFIDAALEELTQAPRDAGIPILVTNYRGEIPKGMENVSFFVDTPTAMGELQASVISQLPQGGDVNGDGTVCYAVLTGPTTSKDTALHLDGLEKGLSEETLLSVKNTDESKDSGFGFCSQLLADFGRDLEVIICSSPESATGAVEAVLDYGRYPGYDVYIVAFGVSEDLKANITSGNVFSSVVADHSDYTQQAVETAKAMLSGNDYQKAYYVSFKTLNASNINE